MSTISQSKVGAGLAPSLELKATWALVDGTKPLSPVAVGVLGGVVSTFHVRVAGVESALPAASIAFTLNVWGPSARPG